MSGVEPNKIDFQGIKLISEDETQSITFKMDGVNKGIVLDYDLLTTPKQFQITPTGVEYTDGVNTYNTGLERIALVQQAFQAVELPPNATTLKLNQTLLLDAGGNQTNTSSVGGLLLQNNSPNPNTYIIDIDNAYALGVPTISLQDNFSGISSVWDTTSLTFNATNQISINPSTGFTITDSVANITNLTLNSLSFNDGTYTPSIGIVANDYVIDGQGARVLINGGDAEFYIGQYSASTAPCIVSGGNSGMYLNLNSRSGVARMGDCDNAFNQTTIIVDDANTTISFDASTIDFLNTSTTTSTSTHTANIKSTSSGLETTTFLKLKLNGTDIWIPYFTTDPSL